MSRVNSLRKKLARAKQDNQALQQSDDDQPFVTPRQSKRLRTGGDTTMRTANEPAAGGGNLDVISVGVYKESNQFALNLMKQLSASMSEVTAAHAKLLEKK